MSVKTPSAFALLALVSAGTAFSAPPPNDNFADRIVVTLDPFPPGSLASYGGSVDGSNVDATKEPGEPDHAGDPGGKSVWWSFTVPANSSARVWAYGPFNTVLAVYTGEDVTNLVSVASTPFIDWDAKCTNQHGRVYGLRGHYVPGGGGRPGR